jgi:hypothetical protein
LPDASWPTIVNLTTFESHTVTLVCESHCRHVYSAHIEVVSLRPLFWDSCKIITPHGQLYCLAIMWAIKPCVKNFTPSYTRSAKPKVRSDRTRSVPGFFRLYLKRFDILKLRFYRGVRKVSVFARLLYRRF